MTISPRHRVLAAVTLAAAAGTMSLAAPALAAPKASKHCSAWKAVGSTRYELRVCGDLTTTKKSDSVLESVFVRNTGRHNVSLDGLYGVAWGQAGTGTGFTDVKVAPGRSTTMTTMFGVGTGTYTISASLTAGRTTATVHHAFTT